MSSEDCGLKCVILYLQSVMYVVYYLVYLDWLLLDLGQNLWPWNKLYALAEPCKSNTEKYMLIYRT